MIRTQTKHLITRALLMLCALLACAVLCACSRAVQEPVQSGSSDEPEQPYEPVCVTVAYWGGLNESPLYVAQEQGLFAEYGIQANFVQVEGSFEEFLEAHSQEYCVCVVSPDFLPQMGLSYQIQLVSEIQRGGVCAIVPKSSSLQLISEARHAKIVSLGEHDMNEVTLRAAMINYNIDYNDCDFYVQPDFAQLLAGLNDGSYDIAVLADPFGQIAETYLGYRMIFNTATDRNYRDITYSFLAVNQPLYENADVQERVAAAVDKACTWITLNPALCASLATGENASQTAYVASEEALLAAFGVDLNGTTSSLYADIVASYSWGNVNESHMQASITALQNSIEAAGMDVSTWKNSK